MIAVVKSIRWIKVNLQETIKPDISNKSKNISGADRAEQFMQEETVKYLCQNFPTFPDFPESGNTLEAGWLIFTALSCRACWVRYAAEDDSVI